jgi:hypothetical protein
VTFLDDGVMVGTGTLSGGKATFSTTALAPGSYSITVSYGGDSNFTGSTSTVLTQTVNHDATTSKVTSSANPSVFGESVTFTATVTAKSPGAGTPTGMVTFLDGTTPLTSLALSGGTVTYSTSSLAVGSNSITIQYAGDSNFTASTSSALTQTVHLAATTTSLTSSSNPSTFGSSVTFTATVTATSPGAGVPGGSVTFKNGAAVLGTEPLNASGVATFSTSSLTVGSHNITASYGGNTDFKTSASAALSQKVLLAPADLAAAMVPQISITQPEGAVTSSSVTAGPAAYTAASTQVSMGGNLTVSQDSRTNAAAEVEILDQLFASLGKGDLNLNDGEAGGQA